MLEATVTDLPADKARALLRKLRDLNLTSAPVAIKRGTCVSVAGCLSLDAPAEKGVRYKLRDGDGAEGLLEIAWSPDGLDLSLSGVRDARRLSVPVLCDGKGRACAPRIGARVAPETCDRRALEHFLRRVVRSLLR